MFYLGNRDGMQFSKILHHFVVGAFRIVEQPAPAVRETTLASADRCSASTCSQTRTSGWRQALATLHKCHCRFRAQVRLKVVLYVAVG